MSQYPNLMSCPFCGKKFLCKRIAKGGKCQWFHSGYTHCHCTECNKANKGTDCEEDLVVDLSVVK